MPKMTRKCRVCGQEYEACHSLNGQDGVFRWQEVACSPECGQVYLEKVLASRRKDGSPFPWKGKKAAERPKQRRTEDEVSPIQESTQTAEAAE